MSRRWLFIVVAGLAALALPARAAVYVSDAARIRRHLAALAEAVSKSDPENPIVGAARCERIAAAFVERPELHLDFFPHAPDNRRELAALAFHVRNAADRIHVQFHDSSVRAAPGGRQAEMRVTARGTIAFDHRKESMLREFRLEWERTDEGWKISRGETVEAIRHPLTGESGPP